MEDRTWNRSFSYITLSEFTNNYLFILKNNFIVNTDTVTDGVTNLFTNLVNENNTAGVAVL